MALDASIYGMIRPQQQGPGPLEQYAQIAQVKNMMGQGQLQDLQMKQAQTAMESDQRVRDLFAGGRVPTTAEVMGASPTTGMAYQKHLLEGQKTKAELKKTEMETLVKATGILKDRLPTVRDEASHQSYVELAKQLLGPDKVAQLGVPQSFDPQWVQRQLVEAKELFTPKPQQVTMPDGSIQMVDVNIFTNPKALDFQAKPGMTPAQTATQQHQAATLAESQRHNQAAEKTATGQRTEASVAGLRKEFNDLPEVKNYRATVPILASAMKAPDNKAGDIQFAYTIGKIFDPNSVVREGELKLVGEAANVMQKYLGELQALTAGKGRLTAQTRAELLAAAESRVGELKSAHDTARATYEKQADAQGLPKDQIFVEIGTQPKKPDDQPKPEATKTIGRIKYVKVNGQWFEER
jgi:hypothetical protein